MFQFLKHFFVFYGDVLRSFLFIQPNVGRISVRLTGLSLTLIFDFSQIIVLDVEFVSYFLMQLLIASFLWIECSAELLFILFFYFRIICCPR